VQLISHPSLTGISSDTGLSGSTQWHNAVRARSYMKGIKPEAGERPDDELRELVFKKNLYGPLSDRVVLRYNNGLFLPVPGMASLDRLAQSAKAQDVFLSLLQRFTRENRKLSDKPGRGYAPAEFVGEEEAKKAHLKKADLREAMRQLFKDERIWNEPYQSANVISATGSRRSQAREGLRRSLRQSRDDAGIGAAIGAMPGVEEMHKPRLGSDHVIDTRWRTFCRGMNEATKPAAYFYRGFILFAASLTHLPIFGILKDAT
jgi:RecA-family ATPase